MIFFVARPDAKSVSNFRRLRSVNAVAEQIVDLDSIEVFGRVVGVCGLMVEIRMI